MLGEAHLAGWVVWTRSQQVEQIAETGRRDAYQSGVTFIGVTPEQHTALAAALKILAQQS